MLSSPLFPETPDSDYQYDHQNCDTQLGTEFNSTHIDIMQLRIDLDVPM